MKKTICWICSQHKLESYMGGSLILFCKFCGHGQTNKDYECDIFKFDGAMHRFGFFGELILRIINYGRCLSILARVKKWRGAFLDCGCGRGEIVNFFSKLGWKSVGTELNNRTAKDARNKGLKILVSEEFPNFVLKNPGTFDLITTFHNLEHVDNPDLFISDCKNLLKSNGKLILEVPNFFALQSILARENWLLLDTKNHFNHFTKKSLSILLSKNGLKFRFLNTWSLKFGPLGMLVAILSNNNRLKNILKFEDLNNHKFNLFSFKFLLIVLLLPFSFLVEICAIFFGRGAVLKVIAYK